MLLRYVALHGIPVTEKDWADYHRWKAKQLALAECRMDEVEASPAESCATCPGFEDCPKANRRK